MFRLLLNSLIVSYTFFTFSIANADENSFNDKAFSVAFMEGTAIGIKSYASVNRASTYALNYSSHDATRDYGNDGNYLYNERTTRTTSLSLSIGERSYLSSTPIRFFNEYQGTYIYREYESSYRSYDSVFQQGDKFKQKSRSNGFRFQWMFGGEYRIQENFSIESAMALGFSFVKENGYTKSETNEQFISGAGVWLNYFYQ